MPANALLLCEFPSALEGSGQALSHCRGLPLSDFSDNIDGTKISYSGYRFPSEIIQQVIWLYVRFTLSFRDVEDLLAERGIVVS